MEKLVVASYSNNQFISLLKEGVKTIRIADERYSYTGKEIYSFRKIDAFLEQSADFKAKLQVKFDRLFCDFELSEIKNTLEQFFIRKIQVVFSDFAIYEIARELGSTHLLIYDPATTLTNYATINALYDLGLNSFVLSRQLSVKEMTEISCESRALIEVQISGIAPIFFSKRKIITNYEIYTETKLPNNTNTFYLEEELRKGEFYPIKEYEYGTIVYHANEIDLLDKVNDLNCDWFLIDNLLLSDEEIVERVRKFKVVVGC